jgi:hypothetical protein
MQINSVFEDFDGNTAFGGALRFYDPADESWRTTWGVYYGMLIPNIRIFASDSFGVYYGLDERNKVAIFWSETGELETLGVGIDEFYTMIKEDPERTINISLYNDAEKKLGKIKSNEHFSFKVELSLGGELSVDNLVITDEVSHMRQLGKIAQQILQLPVGTEINKVELEKDTPYTHVTINDLKEVHAKYHPSERKDEVQNNKQD